MPKICKYNVIIIKTFWTRLLTFYSHFPAMFYDCVLTYDSCTGNRPWWVFGKFLKKKAKTHSIAKQFPCYLPIGTTHRRHLIFLVFKLGFSCVFRVATLNSKSDNSLFIIKVCIADNIKFFFDIIKKNIFTDYADDSKFFTRQSVPIYPLFANKFVCLKNFYLIYNVVLHIHYTYRLWFVFLMCIIVSWSWLTFLICLRHILIWPWVENLSSCKCFFIICRLQYLSMNMYMYIHVKSLIIL